MNNSFIPTFNQLVKELKKDTIDMLTVSVALLGDTATQMLVKAIKACGISHHLNLNLFEADYDQIEMQLFDENSVLHQHANDFILIYKSSLKLLSNFQKLSTSDKTKFAEDILTSIIGYNEAIKRKSKAKVLLFNFIELADTTFYNYGNKVKASWQFQIRKLNYLLMEWAVEQENIFIVDLARLNNQHGRKVVYDTQLYYRTALAMHLDFIPYVAQSVIDIVNASLGKFKKCLILDLDNTMWGGIIGDDGLEKIQIGKLGIGKAFTDLQLWAKTLKERGIILAVCSKNTEHIAKEPFEQHPEMILRLEDISVFVANWENKADNIRYIQSVLNIGFDSMVFLDDNPFERNLVRRELPEVFVPELPEDPTNYLVFLEQFNLFETVSSSTLDADRTLKYQEEAKRSSLQQSFSSLDDFLLTLEMTATIKPFDDYSIPRVTQLIQRSNQFNLRTKRYTAQEIKHFIASDKYYTLSVTLKDKYGDYGLIGLVILERMEKDSLFIDTWIMSCRVLKRGVEVMLLQELVKVAQKENIQYLIGEYIPTKKNTLVKEHYPQLGFESSDKKWILDLKEYQQNQHFIKVTV